MSTITVTNGNDSGIGSLRQAINDAVSGDTIDFDPGVTIITIDSSLDILSKNLTIIGNGSSSLQITNNLTNFRFITIDNSSVSISGIKLKGNGGSGGIVTSNAINLTLNDVIIEDHSFSTFGFGAGMHFNGGTLNMTNTIIQNNSTNSNGGGVYIQASGANISNSSIIGNISASGNGGGMYITPRDANGLLASIVDTSIESNSANEAGGIYLISGGFFMSVSINRCAILNNSASLIGGIHNTNTTLGLYNTTINGNSSTSGAGGISASIATIRNCTITENTTSDANRAGGIYSASSGTLISNTIVANNINSGGGPLDVSGAFTATPPNSGFNFIGNKTGSTDFNDPSNLTGNPILGPLANNGGPTLSQTPLPGSPVIDKGSNSLIPPGVQLDQRHFNRIINGGISLTVDIGSVEFDPSTVCYSGNSILLTKNKLTGEILELAVKNVYSDEHEVYSTVDGNFVPVIYNIITGPTKRYIKIPKDFFEKDKPSQNFYVTGGHKIVINDKETKAASIPNCKRIKVKPELVYSICTENRCPILVNNLDVIAWGKDEWLQIVKKRGYNWKDNTNPNKKLDYVDNKLN